jgi:hypothetical protein
MEVNKKKEFGWVIYLGITVVISLMVFGLFKLITPKETIIQKTDFITTNKDQQKTNFAGITFVGSPIEPPQKLPILTIQPEYSAADTIKNNLIEQFKLVKHPKLSGLWLSDLYSLSYNELDKAYIFFDKTYKVEDADLYITNINKAISVSTNFVKGLFPNLTLEVDKTNLVYLEGIVEMHPGEKNEANAVMIPFNYMYQGVPLFVEKNRGNLLELIVNARDEVKKITFKEDIINFAPSEKNISIINLTDAITNINNNEALILNSYSDDGLPYSISDIAYGDLETVKLEYRADLTTNIAYPFYHFYGELVNNDNKSFKAEIITPAVKTIE